MTTRQSLVDPAVVDKLCPELRDILNAELAAGNVVDETSREYPLSLNIWLRRPFVSHQRTLPAHVVFRKVNDPHYWLAEYECEKHKHLLACKYR